MTMVSEIRSIEPSNSKFIRLSTMSTAEKLTVKIKLSTSRSTTEITEAEPKRSSHLHPSTIDPPFFVNDERGAAKQKGSVTNQLHRNRDNCFGNDDRIITGKPSAQPVMNCGNKRGPLTNLDNQKQKKGRFDSGMSQQCAAVLKKLMTDNCSWAFNQPVDPVKWLIPDYFSIISKPMDLGTIKSNLRKKLYTCPEEFAADVRLTFSNAMLYNPPGNDFHMMAKKLLAMFDSTWESLEAKWSVKCTTIEPLSKKAILAHEPGKDYKKTSESNSLHTRVSMSSAAQKQKVQGMKKACIRSRHDDSDHTETSCGRDFLQKDLHKGTSNSYRRASGSVSLTAKAKAVSNPSGLTGSCGSMIGPVPVNNLSDPSPCVKVTYERSTNYNCNRPSDFTEASSEVDSEQSSGRDGNRALHDGACNLDSLVDDTPSRRMSKSDPESDGAVSAVDDTGHPSSRPALPLTTATSGEGWETNTYDGSPTKALRAAMLRSRFADTIVKAQQKTLLNNGEKVDPLKMKREKERLEKQQREEKARIEAQIRAAEAASRMKKETELKLQRESEEAELKRQREMEREAARIALEEMKKTVDICENRQVLKDLQMLAGLPSDSFFIDSNRSPECLTAGIDITLTTLRGSPLERLGLFLKDDYMEEEDELDERTSHDVEEGEIA